MNDWKEYTLKEISEGIYDGPHATPRRATDGGIFLGIKNITEDGRIDLNDIYYISDEDLIKWNKRVVPQFGDLVFSYEATLHRYALIPENFHGCLGRRMALVRPKKNLIHIKYLYYLFLSPFWRSFIEANLISGATVDRIPLIKFPKFKISIPKLSIQENIVSVLGVYDDLMDVNKQRIKVLEKTALELYKEWFVRMRFPGFINEKIRKGVPLSWKVSAIGKVIDYNIGGGWGNDNQDKEYSVPGYVIRGTDIPGVRSGKVNKEVYRFHKASNMKSRQLFEGDIVFETAGGSEGQPLGRTCYITQEILDAYGDKVMAASFCKQIRTTSIPSLYLYYFINYLYDTGMIEAFQVQSTGISNYQFEPFLKFQQIILPTPELMQLFHDHVIVIQKQIATLGIQNDHLRQIRDRLLPRLISGKLEVKA